MDTALVNVYRLMVSQFGCSAEDILEDPDLRNNFLTEVRSRIGNETKERQILHRLSYLRKQRRLPRLRDLVCTAENSPDNLFAQEHPTTDPGEAA